MCKWLKTTTTNSKKQKRAKTSNQNDMPLNSRSKVPCWSHWRQAKSYDWSGQLLRFHIFRGSCNCLDKKPIRLHLTVHCGWYCNLKWKRVYVNVRYVSRRKRDLQDKLTTNITKTQLFLVIDATSAGIFLIFITITAGWWRPLADTVRCVAPTLFGGGTVNVPAGIAGIRCHGAVVVAPRGDVGAVSHIERICTTV